MQLCFCASVYRIRTKSIDVTEIRRDIYLAEGAQDRANDDLEAASQDTDMTRNRIAEVKYELTGRLPPQLTRVSVTVLPFQSNNNLYNLEAKLMSQRPEDLSRRIRDVQEKTEQNRRMAADAREAADAALQNATAVEQVSVCVCVSRKQPSGRSDRLSFRR